MICVGDVVRTTYNFGDQGKVQFLILNVKKKIELIWDEDLEEDFEEEILVVEGFNPNYPKYTHGGDHTSQIDTGHFYFHIYSKYDPDIVVVG